MAPSPYPIAMLGWVRVESAFPRAGRKWQHAAPGWITFATAAGPTKEDPTKVRSLVVAAVLAMTFGTRPFGRRRPLADPPPVGEQLSMADGSPAPLSAGDQLTAGLAPVVDESGIVLATALDRVQALLAPNSTSSNTAITTASACTPYTGVDNPHVSSSEFVASGHGWWRKGNCSGTTATVTTCLLEWWVGSDSTGRWVTKKCNNEPNPIKPAPYGTRKPSVTARIGCTNSKYTGWANVVDVNVNGVSDTSETRYMTANIYCRRL